MTKRRLHALLLVGVFLLYAVAFLFSYAAEYHRIKEDMFRITDYDNDASAMADLPERFENSFENYLVYRYTSMNSDEYEIPHCVTAFDAESGEMLYSVGVVPEIYVWLSSDGNAYESCIPLSDEHLKELRRCLKSRYAQTTDSLLLEKIDYVLEDGAFQPVNLYFAEGCTLHVSDVESYATAVWEGGDADLLFGYYTAGVWAQDYNQEIGDYFTALYHNDEAPYDPFDPEAQAAQAPPNTFGVPLVEFVTFNGTEYALQCHAAFRPSQTLLHSSSFRFRMIGMGLIFLAAGGALILIADRLYNKQPRLEH